MNSLLQPPAVTDLKDYFPLAHAIRELLRDWERQDAELADAQAALDPADRDPAQEDAERLKVRQNRNRQLRDLIWAPPVPELQGCIPLILYFDNERSVDSFIAAVQEAKPNFRPRRL